jgi:hypothetical protein
MKNIFAPGRHVKEDDELEIFNCIKVISMSLIVLGNTYFYVMTGPLQNIQVIDRWPKGKMFMFVLQADLQSDVFYWITAFCWSF